MSNEFEETYNEPAASETPAAPARPGRTGGSTTRRTARPQGGLPPQLPWWIAGAAVVIAAVLGIYFGAIRSSSPTKTANGTTGLHGHYRLVYPKDWKIVAPDSVAPGQNAFAAVRQSKGLGVVVLRAGGKIQGSLTGSYLHGLETQLKRRSKDYKFVGAHMISIKSGHALDLTYDLTKRHQVRNVVVLSLSSGSVVFATVAPIGNAKTTREIDEIVSSFQLTQ